MAVPIYLHSAIGYVRTLIEKGLKVYGPAAIKAGEGDLYLLESPEGTYVLIRTATGGTTATPYFKLPPAVAQAWLGAMGEAKQRSLCAGRNGEPDHTLYTITYLHKNGELVAVRDQWEYPSRRHIEVNTRELQQAATKAES